MRPPGPEVLDDFAAPARAPGGVGRTIRWVDRVDWLVLGRAGFRPMAPVRGTDMGWVVAAPAGMGVEGIKPVG